MILLYLTFKFQINLVKSYLMEHLEKQKNGFDFISEYNIKWNTYAASLHEIEDNLKTVLEIFNEAYEKAYEDHPRFPKIQIWRLMIKLWIKDMFGSSTIRQ